MPLLSPPEPPVDDPFIGEYDPNNPRDRRMMGQPPPPPPPGPAPQGLQPTPTNMPDAPPPPIVPPPPPPGGGGMNQGWDDGPAPDPSSSHVEMNLKEGPVQTPEPGEAAPPPAPAPPPPPPQTTPAANAGAPPGIQQGPPPPPAPEAKAAPPATPPKPGAIPPATKQMGPNMIKGNATQEALDYGRNVIMDPKTGKPKQPSVFKNILGALAQTNRFTRGMDVHPNLTRQYENYGMLKDRAEEERKLQVAQATEDRYRSAKALDDETRRAVAMGRSETTGLGTRPSIIASNVITPDSYKARLARGEQFLDIDNQPITVDLAPNEVLQMMGMGGSKIRYAVRNQADKLVRVGEHLYAVSPQMAQQLPQGAGVDLGVTRTPTTKSTEHLATDAAGNTVANTLNSTSIPSTPGITGRPGAPAAVPQGAPGQATAPPGPPAAPGAPPPARVLNPSPAAREAQIRKVGPIREASMQIFGDPAQPHMRSLQSFYKLADDPQAVARTGKFLGMVIDAMKTEEAGHAGVGGTLGPVNVSAGGFGSWLQQLMNMPGQVAGERVANMQKALSALTPEEKAYVDAFLASRSAAIGLRAATGAGAYKYAVDALELDLPYLGFNTNNSTQYLDKLQHIGMIAANGIKNYSPDLMDQDSPGTYNRIKNITQELESLKAKPAAPAAATAPATSPVPPPRAAGGVVDYEDPSYPDQVLHIPADKLQKFLATHPNAKRAQ